jgi:hypothetical protein
VPISERLSQHWHVTIEQQVFQPTTFMGRFDRESPENHPEQT